MPLFRPLQKNPKTGTRLTPPPQIIAILGPTASGKTALAIHLAQIIKTEIVSCDSRGIYKGLKRLTAVPPGRWRKRLTPHAYVTQEGVPYHLADFLDPSRQWDAAKFAASAKEKITKILSHKDRAIIAGGSGFYWRALAHGLGETPPVDQKLRNRLTRELAAKGLASLAAQLRRLDPATYRLIDRQNPRRVQRSLELCLQLKQPLSEFRKNQQTNPLPWRWKAFYLNWPAAVIKARITQRTKTNFSQMAEEVRRAQKKWGKKFLDMPGSQSLLARPVADYLNRKITKEAALRQCIALDYGYSKRQRTWFRKEKNLIPINFSERAAQNERVFLKEAARQVLKEKW